jgi:hypothetical protein
MKNGNWSTEKVREKLKQAHEQENEINKQISTIDNQIKFLSNKKTALAKRVSKNMQYRNNLIKLL